MEETKQKILNNFSIRELTDSRGNIYYLVIDNDQEKNNGYLCFNDFRAYEVISEQYAQTNQYVSARILNLEYIENEKNGKKVRKILECMTN